MNEQTNRQMWSLHFIYNNVWLKPKEKQTNIFDHNVDGVFEYWWCYANSILW